MPSYWIRQVRHTNASNPDALAERKTKGTDEQTGTMVPIFIALKTVYFKFVCYINNNSALEIGWTLSQLSFMLLARFGTGS